MAKGNENKRSLTWGISVGGAPGNFPPLLKYLPNWTEELGSHGLSSLIVSVGRVWAEATHWPLFHNLLTTEVGKVAEYPLAGQASSDGQGWMHSPWLPGSLPC